MRLSTCTVENVFARASAMTAPGGHPDVLAAQALINLAKPSCSAEDKSRILESPLDLLLQGDEVRSARLRQNRSRPAVRWVAAVTATDRAAVVGDFNDPPTSPRPRAAGATPRDIAASLKINPAVARTVRRHRHLRAAVLRPEENHRRRWPRCH